MTADQQGPRPGRRAVLRQATWSLLGQAANSLSNLLLVLAAARASTAHDFGIFSLVIVFYALTVAGTRSIVSTPMLMAVPGLRGGARISEEIRGSVSACLILGLGLAAPAVAAGMLLGGQAGRMLVLLAAFIPVLLVQDGVRYAFIAQGRAVRSSICDATWLALQIGLTVPLLLGPVRDPAAYLLVWGGAGAVATLLGVLSLGLRPSLRAGRAFLISHQRVLPNLFSDYVAATAVTQLTPYAVAALAGIAAVGGLRAGLVLLGVVNVLVMGVTPLAQLEATRSHHRAPDHDQVFVRRWTSVVAGVSLIYAVALLVLPEEVGRALLGETWAGTSQLLVPLALYLVVSSPSSAVQISLRARMQLRSALRLRFISAPALPICASAGALIGGAQGAAWGFACSASFASVCALLTLRRVERRQRAGEPEGPAPAAHHARPSPSLIGPGTA